MARIYNKLVRDGIPEICRANGETPVTEILNDGQYLDALHQKLQEEVQEYLEEESLEELADIAEVLEAIIKAQGFTVEQLLDCKAKKQAERGGFEKHICLKEVIK